MEFLAAESSDYLNRYNVSSLTAATTLSNISSMTQQLLNCSASDERDKVTLIERTDKLIIIYSWIMLIFGTISNLLSFSVMRGKKLKKSSTFFYLSCLSIIDLNVLILFCSNFILYYQFNINIQKINIVFCKLYSFLIYFLPQFSAWTCAAVSLDRVVNVIFSVSGKYVVAAKKWNRPKSSLKVVIIIGAALFLVNAHLLFYNDSSSSSEPSTKISVDESTTTHTNNLTIQLGVNVLTTRQTTTTTMKMIERKEETYAIEDVNRIYCEVHKSFAEAWSYIDLSLNVLVPFTIMIICSVVIMNGIITTTRNLRANTNNNNASKHHSSFASRETDQMDQRSNNRLLSMPRVSISVRHLSIVSNKQQQQASPSSKFFQMNKSRKASTVSSATSSKTRNVSCLLATNNFVFISLTLPIVLFLAFAEFESKIEQLDKYCGYYLAKLRLMKTICIILMNGNSAINIFVYSLTASEFRRQLYGLVKKKIMICKSMPASSELSSRSGISVNLNNNYTETAGKSSFRR